MLAGEQREEKEERRAEEVVVLCMCSSGKGLRPVTGGVRRDRHDRLTAGLGGVRAPKKVKE